MIKEYGISQTALTKWIKQYSTVEIDIGEIFTAKQIKDLQKKNALLEKENQILKSDCHIHATLNQRLDAIHKLSGQYKIKSLCRVLRVNMSTYYKHLCPEPAARTNQNQIIRTAILHGPVTSPISRFAVTGVIFVSS